MWKYYLKENWKYKVSHKYFYLVTKYGIKYDYYLLKNQKPKSSKRIKRIKAYVGATRRKNINLSPSAKDLRYQDRSTINIGSNSGKGIDIIVNTNFLTIKEFMSNMLIDSSNY